MGPYSLPASEGGSFSLSVSAISMFSRQEFALSAACSVRLRCSCVPSSSRKVSYSSLPWVPEVSRGPLRDLPAEGRPMSADVGLGRLTSGEAARKPLG